MLKAKRIMLIENNPKDADNILNIIESLNSNYKLLHFTTTKEALENLKKENISSQLILLGSSNGDDDSIEFLKNIKNDNNLKKIPVVIISTSEEHIHVLNCFIYGAASYMVKPGKHLELAGLIKTIVQYWNICELPCV
ncbi:MAG: response regulator [Sedimentisphaerales bacterium]|nr:response regulator [Sedimentisphaerales bacterium]